MASMFKHVSVLGPGLLGASLLMAVKARNLCAQTSTWSRRLETRRKCQGQPWCDLVFDQASDAVRDADLVVLSTPVETIGPLLEEIGPHLQAGALVTDVGSTKRLICEQAQAAIPSGVDFVGSHPMAGSEKTGLEHASPHLFRQQACFVTPLPETSPSATARAIELWQALEMKVATVPPDEHDRIVAHISHLPHFLASVLCTFLSHKPENWKNFAGGGLRDTTRIAAGDPGIWQSIANQNREEILHALEGFSRELQGLLDILRQQDSNAVKQLLETGKQYRDTLRFN